MRRRGISSQIAVPFALFVFFGSLALVTWLTLRERAESRQAFVTLAETNAQFIARSSYPPSPMFADALSEVLEMKVSFATLTESFEPPVPAEIGVVVNLGDGREAVRCRIEEGIEVMFARERLAFGQQVARASTLLPLLVFWILSFVLAAVISKRLVRPIHSLAAGVDALESSGNDAAEFPGGDRIDEIGQLSRALTETHRHLIKERVRREEGERAALLGKMATGLAHEIRNPVAAIRLHAQLLESCERCAGSAATIVGEAETVESLVNQWMFLSKPEPPELRRQEVGECLKRCLDALTPAAEHAGIVISPQLEPELVADIDAVRVGQVFRNLVQNAIHAMPGGGELTIVGRRDGGGLEFVFRDEGEGFTSKALARHGELFFTTKEGGMGVGLSVSKEIVAGHSGRLEVVNRTEGGAEVTVWLPASSNTKSS